MKDLDPDKENKLTFFIWMQISDKKNYINNQFFWSKLLNENSNV